ncbi:hypothetical protein Halru_0592 [Halovivax ruber XH-70]|uniref:Uncharacterized protein n=2 Tax=Halovivax ruber TaxID=387341 RepID=L0I8T9_HALRX|nr:hypothetical protein Halru_0592 [Halovivax ruber XH-70]
MKAIITGENDERAGVNLRDNNGIEHVIELEFDGEIKYHETDGYTHEFSKRSKEETEHCHQARRLAKWHVYREQGYDTVIPSANPDRIVAAILAILDMPSVEVEHYFGNLEAELLRYQNGSYEHLPFEDVDPSELYVYRQDIWVTPDPTEANPPLLEQFCEYVDSPLQTLGEILGDGPDPRDSLPAYEIEAVSDVHYLYSDGRSREEQWTDQPLDREPDARIELLAIDPDAFDSFAQLLASHLGNQIRDRFLDMGLEPPKPFQTPGLGTHDAMIKQQLMPMYDRHFLASEHDNPWDQTAGFL